MIPKKIFGGVAFCLIFTANSPQCQAQSKAAAFDSVTIGLNWLGNINRNTFHKFWKPGQGVEGYVQLPFYYGAIEVGLHVQSFDGDEKEQPDFTGILLDLRWQKEWGLFRDVSGSLGGNVGMYQMAFDSDNLFTNESHIVEREFAFGVTSGLGYAVAPNWSINVSVSFLRVYTRKRLDLVFLGVGVSRRFASPSWLREFLK